MITDKQRQRDYEYEADYQSKSRYTTEQWTNILNSGQLDEKNISLLKQIYSSFNHYSIQQMKKIVPEAETAYLYSDVILNVAEYAKNTKVDGLHPAVYHVKMADFLKEYLGSNLNVRVWTVNEKADMKWLIDAGVTAIITNYPDMAVQIKKEAEV